MLPIRRPRLPIRWALPPPPRLLTLALWRDVFYHLLRYRLLSLSAGIAYWALFSLLLGCLMLLLATGLMDPGWRSGLVDPLSRVVPLDPLTNAVAWVEALPLPLRQRYLLISGFLAWWLGTTALQGVMRAFDLMHQIPVRWRRSRLPLTVMAALLAGGLGLSAALALNLAYAGSGTVAAAQQAGESFALWAAVLRRLLYWLLAWGGMSGVFGLIYRLGSSRLMPATPLMPGALVTATLWIGSVALWQRSHVWVQGFQATFSTIGGLLLLMAWVYGSVLAVLIGDQVNVSLARQRALPPQIQARPGMPPSFDSFTIRRRDRLP